MPGRLDLVAEQVERRAQAADHGDRARCGSSMPRVADGQRVVAADDLAEVARRGELVVHAAVDDEVGLRRATPSVDHPGHVDARLADEVAAELDDDPWRPAAPARAGSSTQLGEVVADGVEVERLVLLEVGDAEAAAEVDVRAPAAGTCSASSSTRSTVRCAGPRRGSSALQVLRAGEDVEADDVDAVRRPARRAGRAPASASTPNCWGPPPIRMPEPLTAKSGLTRTATRGRSAELLAGCARAAAASVARLDLDESRPAATARRSSASVLPGRRS